MRFQKGKQGKANLAFQEWLYQVQPPVSMAELGNETQVSWVLETHSIHFIILGTQITLVCWYLYEIVPSFSPSPNSLSAYTTIGGSSFVH